jgi:hypothetical protein
MGMMRMTRETDMLNKAARREIPLRLDGTMENKIH